jgi:hypothetical protein|tara:strand:- start:562 stop:801 length:240 start_codon:yes stop_codon:yes gene_type:complete
MNIEKDMTRSERLAVIREHAEKFNKKLKRNQRVRKTETISLDKYTNQENINHWTDASQYANQYYGDVYRQTTRYDNDWD